MDGYQTHVAVFKHPMPKKGCFVFTVYTGTDF